MNVLPEYLEGNRTGSYTPEQWLDEVKDKNSDEIIQEGTPMDAEHFNHMEQGIHNNSLMLALLLENVKHTQQSVESVDGEELEVTLTNTKDFYFNNSVKTVALANMRSTLDYRVITEVQGNPVNVGDVVVYDKQVNGFKIAFTGRRYGVVANIIIHSDERKAETNRTLRDYGINPEHATKAQRDMADCVAQKTGEACRELRRYDR